MYQHDPTNRKTYHARDRYPKPKTKFQYFHFVSLLVVDEDATITGNGYHAALLQGCQKNLYLLK